ncbi:hypothetical protein MKX03_006798 [Papaver bracteatum]|nr:hypothetical protein MKX03_006798 [Papaver bracteatum]
MQLHKEVFDLAIVINEAVNFIYPRGLEKGIDVVLDYCDGSFLKSSLVKGDHGKLKQVLNNLLSNTSLLLPKYNGIWKCISHLVYNNTGKDYTETLHTLKHNENS